MYAFRAAHAAKDATKKLDLRDRGERVIAGRRASAGSLVTEAVLRREVARDLEALLNTINLNSTQRLDDVPHVADSILNFGIPDIVHRSIDEKGVDDIVAELEAAFRRFEPRLAGHTVKVRRDRTVGIDELKVRFYVAAEITMSPENVPVEFVADVEVDSGKIVLSRV
ncbi:type VI secretion system baseplate subunit TssE [Siculibacillus lacustris]|uniref:Type VI secretion system baseplate subunit TssE n=2 Tax=Siculibacillus lacustris TaxID=1549641 RepID=A0A4Q9VNF0_9HYPH|nr:type VI secretion system baseplate subunit TssE [Siculibacillus lacustris]